LQDAQDQFLPRLFIARLIGLFAKRNLHLALCKFQPGVRNKTAREGVLLRGSHVGISGLNYQLVELAGE
jgi:hypothetical protein